jgi:hypothetical protein
MLDQATRLVTEDNPLNALTRKARLLVATVLGGGTLLLAAAPAAQAGVLVESATNCTTPPFEQPFTRWLDYSTYVLAPGGSFENGADGWSLKNASVGAGNESYDVGGAGDSHSLTIAPGGSAVSPTMCVGLDRPTLRFFARSSAGLLSLSTLAVSVRFETSLGLVAELPVGVVVANTRWQPSLPMPVIASLLPLLPGAETPVQFRFTPVGGASWSIDDVYVDPKARG